MFLVWYTTDVDCSNIDRWVFTSVICLGHSLMVSDLLSEYRRAGDHFLHSLLLSSGGIPKEVSVVDVAASLKCTAGTHGFLEEASLVWEIENWFFLGGVFS